MLLALATWGAVMLAAASAQAAPAATYIVQLRADVTLSDGAGLVRAAGGRVAGRLGIINGLAVRLRPAARRALARDARVAAISVNARVRPKVETVVPVDPALGDASTGATVTPTPDPTATASPTPDPTATASPTPDPAPPPSQPAAPPDPKRLATAYPFSVHAPQAWDMATGAGVGVAVIDTGIDGALPDFRAADGSSRVIASAVTNPGATTAQDTYGHGTHVAGIIAGNGGRRDPADPLVGRYVGIAPDADLISVKVGDDGGFATVLDVIYGLQFAVDHKDDYKIRIVNLSLESTVAQSYKTDPLDAAVESAYFHGLLVVAAAGNHGATADAADYAPGNDPFALTVGAVDDKNTSARGDDVFAEWSSVGLTQDDYAKPEIGAPGAHIVSALAPGSAFAGLCPACVVDGEYIRAGGTSMAAPVVSGVAALMLQRHPEWTPDQLKRTIIDTGKNLEGGVDEVNAADAVATAVPASGPILDIPPNTLVDGASGEIDYTRSSWSRSSWSTAGALSAGWARSSWSCICGTADTGAVDPTRSSWSRSSWSTHWNY